MVTPTGAAILATLARFETPAMRIERVGYGFGRKSFPWPNCLRLCLGRPLGVHMAAADNTFPDTDWVTVIESNIDNMTGEALGDLMERLLAAGAVDASYVPLQVQKNRPAVLVSGICRVEEGDALAQLLLIQSRSVGLR